MARPRSFVALGDSIVLGGGGYGSGVGQSVNLGQGSWAAWAAFLSKQHLLLIRNSGGGGDTSAQMLARIDADVIAQTANCGKAASPTSDPASPPSHRTPSASGPGGCFRASRGQSDSAASTASRFARFTASTVTNPDRTRFARPNVSATSHQASESACLSNTYTDTSAPPIRQRP